MNKDLEIESRVKLSPDTRWKLGVDYNPLNTVGVVREIDGVVMVEWGNGCWNGYYLKDNDLIPVNDSEGEQI